MKLKLVFYMSNEEIFKKDDLSREFALLLQANKSFNLECRGLLFYIRRLSIAHLQGACYMMDEDKVKRIIRHDVRIRLPFQSSLRLSVLTQYRSGVLDRSPTWLQFWASLPSLLGYRNQWPFAQGDLKPILCLWKSGCAHSKNLMFMSRPDGDVQLLVLSRADANELFDNYPEQVCKSHGVGSKPEWLEADMKFAMNASGFECDFRLLWLAKIRVVP